MGSHYDPPLIAVNQNSATTLRKGIFPFPDTRWVSSDIYLLSLWLGTVRMTFSSLYLQKFHSAYFLQWEKCQWHSQYENLKSISCYFYCVLPQFWEKSTLFLPSIDTILANGSNCLWSNIFLQFYFRRKINMYCKYQVEWLKVQWLLKQSII